MFVAILGYPRCNIIYSFSLFYGLLSGLGLLLRMLCFLSVLPGAPNDGFLSYNLKRCFRLSLRSSSFKFLYFHILIKNKEQELGRMKCGGVKTKTHGVDLLLNKGYLHLN